ncbi:AraC family transcriptional regulator [uncultured Victivallis sp.]|uniref:helix-turn-helix transcriptional regulator n=1 Tax=uncultured Victivallis sp. TaxID=354118 RepID=UPI0025979163|nr:AraC family transcriptional regulator [uncultured Victivallis sp.]
MERQRHWGKDEIAFFFADSPERELISRLDLDVLVSGMATKDDLDVFHPFRSDPYFRFYYVVDGNVSLVLADGSYLLEPGMVYLIPADRPFRYSAAGKFTHYWLHFRSSRLEKVDYFRRLIGLKAPPDTEALMRDLLRCAEIGDGAEALIGADVILRRLLTPFLTAMPKSDYEQGVNIGRYSTVLEYIDRNLEKNLIVTQLAVIAGMNYNNFSADFHRTFGITPKQYICNHRIERAKALLLGSDLTIKQVSARVGYDNEFFFYRLFKKYTGQTPKYFRNNNMLG